MSIAAAASRDVFMPRPPGGAGRGLVLALLVHAFLVAGLAVGVNWRTSSPQGMQAELWAAVPQVAAPRAAAPEPRPAPPTEPVRPPPPRPVVAEPPAPPQPVLPDPQIAIEQARREQRAQRLEEAREQERQKQQAKKLALAKAQQAEKVEKERAEKEKADKKRKDQETQRDKERDRAEAARVADAREAAVKRMLNQAGGSTGEAGSSGKAAQNAAPSAGYAGRVMARIKPNIKFHDELAAIPGRAEVLISLAPDGRIISSKLTRSSGSKEWDQAVLRAIERTEMLPRDTDGRVLPSMVIVFNPLE